MVSPNVVIFFAISLFLCTSSVSSKKPDANAIALLAFKSKADPHNKLWFSSTASSFCRWTGVECSQAKPVRFVVEDMNLGGIFPPNTLTRLDQIRVLSLRNNSLTGPIPDLSGLLNLKELFLSQNYFTGSIPASVSSLHRLKTLELSDNHLSGPVPKELGNLDRLYTLRLDSNWLNGSIPALNQSNLRIFNVSKNSLTGPIPVTETLLRMETSSFWWNPGLCGEILHIECREMQHFFGRASPPPPTVAAEAELGENAATDVVLSHPKTEKSHRKTAIVIGFSSAGFVFLCSLICLALAARKRRKGGGSTTKLRNYPAGESSIDAHIEAVMRIEEENHELEEKIRRVQEGVQIAGMGKSGNLVFCSGDPAAENYTLEKLMRASAELLGRGSLAATYKAVLDSGAVVCVKRLDAAKMAGTSREVFEGHMQAVGGLRHPNLVPLRAYFQARDERLLIYDYQPNGSLFSLIHCSKSARAKPLHWTSCLKIAEDVAQGLSYIHQAWRLVHGNLKSSNVLLGSDFEACLTDHCLATLTTAAPDDHREELTAKSDVYSFGILVLELLSGKLPAELPDLEGGTEAVMRWVKLNRDGDDENGEDGNKVEMLVEVGVACSVSSPEQRPTMWQVLKMIQEIKEAVVMEDL